MHEKLSAPLSQINKQIVKKFYKTFWWLSRRQHGRWRWWWWWWVREFKICTFYVSLFWFTTDLEKFVLKLSADLSLRRGRIIVVGRGNPEQKPETRRQAKSPAFSNRHPAAGQISRQRQRLMFGPQLMWRYVRLRPLKENFLLSAKLWNQFATPTYHNKIIQIV